MIIDIRRNMSDIDYKLYSSYRHLFFSIPGTFHEVNRLRDISNRISNISKDNLTEQKDYVQKVMKREIHNLTQYTKPEIDKIEESSKSSEIESIHSLTVDEETIIYYYMIQTLLIKMHLIHDGWICVGDISTDPIFVEMHGKDFIEKCGFHIIEKSIGNPTFLYDAIDHCFLIFVKPKDIFSALSWGSYQTNIPTTYVNEIPGVIVEPIHSILLWDNDKMSSIYNSASLLSRVIYAFFPGKFVIKVFEGNIYAKSNKDLMTLKLMSEQIKEEILKIKDNHLKR